MPKKEAIVNNEPKELLVPTFNKKEIEGIAKEEIKKAMPIKVLSSTVQVDQDGRNVFEDVDVRNELYDWLNNRGFSKEVCFIIFYDFDADEYGLGLVSPSTNGDVHFIVGNSQMDLTWEKVGGNKVVYFD